MSLYQSKWCWMAFLPSAPFWKLKSNLENYSTFNSNPDYLPGDIILYSHWDYIQLLPKVIYTLLFIRNCQYSCITSRTSLQVPEL